MSEEAYDSVHGTLVFIGDPGMEAATQLEGLDDISAMPGEDMDLIETTRLDQTKAGGGIDWIRRYKRSLENPGTLEMTFGKNQDLYEMLLEEKGEDHSWKVQFAEGDKLNFEGLIRNTKMVQGDGEWLISVKVQISGEITYTPA